MAGPDVLAMINQNRPSVKKVKSTGQGISKSVDPKPKNEEDDDDEIEVLDASKINHNNTTNESDSAEDFIIVEKITEENKPKGMILTPLNSVSPIKTSPKGKDVIVEKERTTEKLNTDSPNDKELKRLMKEAEKKKKEEEREAEKKRKEEERLKQKREIELKKELLKKEKEDKERIRQEEKAERERKRLEEKAERERKKLEEKLEKEKEKAEKERKRLEEKEKKEDERLKQEELKKKEEEAKKKQKQKLQISNFFKPKTVVSSTKTNSEPSLEINDNISETKPTTKSKFDKTFHDFYIREGTTLYNPASLISEKDRIRKIEIDKALGLSASFNKPQFNKQESLDWISSKSKIQSTKIEQIAEQIFEKQADPSSLLIRFIKFYENVQTYSGTFTKPFNKELLKNPFITEEPIFIEFDDEGDENEEGEGEDIDDLDDDEEEEEDEDEDINDFLEQDLTPSSGNPKITGPLIPKISWKSDNEQNYKIEILKQNVQFPIDPKRNYWEIETIFNSTPKRSSDLTNPNSSPTKPDDSTPNKNKRPKTLIQDKKDLETFAKQVNQSDYTIPTMVEILKKHLPSYTKATIENTLKAVAKRVGPKSTEKKWEINNEVLLQLGQ